MEYFQDHSFRAVTGMVVEMAPVEIGVGQAEGCILYVTVEDDDGNIVKFLLSPDTFVVDWETIEVGQQYMFWYRTDEPAPMIEPPQYNAAVAARVRNDQMVDVSHYNAMLVNREQTLQINMDECVKLRTTNNQYFRGNPANHDLVVVFDHSTRSIPAQTTPKTVIVLCRNFME